MARMTENSRMLDIPGYGGDDRASVMRESTFRALRELLVNRIYDLPGKRKSMPRAGRLLREGTFVAHERCPGRRRRGPLILLSPYKFRATKTLCIFIWGPGTRKRKGDITSAISRGNTRAVWPDRVTIRTRDIHLKRHRFINQSSLSAIARTSTHPLPFRSSLHTDLPLVSQLFSLLCFAMRLSEIVRLAFFFSVVRTNRRFETSIYV